MRQRGKGVFARATIRVCDVRAYGWIVWEKAHQVGAYDALWVCGRPDADGQRHGGPEWEGSYVKLSAPFSSCKTRPASAPAMKSKSTRKRPLIA